MACQYSFVIPVATRWVHFGLPTRTTHGAPTKRWHPECPPREAQESVIRHLLCTVDPMGDHVRGAPGNGVRPDPAGELIAAGCSDRRERAVCCSFGSTWVSRAVFFALPAGRAISAPGRGPGRRVAELRDAQAAIELS
jgi:hypothetical protein